MQTGDDPFLRKILTQYHGTYARDKPTYFSIFDTFFGVDDEETISWMHNLSQRISVPQWMNSVAKYQWSSIYTSVIDETIIRAFRSDWRRVSVISSTKQSPSDLTNRKNLHCTYLFGSVLDMSKDGRPPLNLEDYRDRCRDGSEPLLKRIYEKITPLGTLVIESYDPNNDWLKPDTLRWLIKKLIKGQTFLFSADRAVRENEYLSRLISEGKIIVFDEPLSVILEEGVQYGEIKLGTIPNEETDYYINIGERTFSLPATIWNKISQFAEILDTSMFAEPERLSKDERDIEFQHFLSHSSKKPIWSAYCRNFAFVRDYENKLEKMIHSRMQNKEIEDCPIILHGQTGTGKTIALQQLAYKMGRHKYPVLYLDGFYQEIDKVRESIDEFCEWAENNGSNKVLIIWDGMLRPENYQHFFNYLSNRGRKIALVGSYYNLESGNRPTDPPVTLHNCIKAPVRLISGEIERLLDHFSTFYPELTNLLRKNPILLTNDNFFVFLYYLIPASRSMLYSGIETEAENTVKELRNKSSTKKLSFGTSLMEQILIEAGISIPIEPKIDYEKQCPEIFEKLIQYVMVPGRLGEDVPLNLIQRTIHSSDYYTLLEILESEDIFIVNETSEGDFYISPRQSLEAKLICNYKFGGPREEIIHCLDLINNVYNLDPGNRFSDENIELKFILNLVKKLGPNGPEKERYKDYYYEISKKLADLRQKQSIRVPNLILQEANLAREYVRSKKHEPLDNKTSILEKSIDLLNTTILEMKKSRFRNSNLIDQMTIELAATKSTRLTHLLNMGVSTDFLNDLYSIHRDLDEVLKNSVNDEYALDIYGWSAVNIVKNSSLSEIETNEILTKALTVIEIGETSAFGIDDNILYRKKTLFELMGENKLSKDTFDLLKKRGSRVGYLRSSIEATSKIDTDALKYNEDEVEIFKRNFLFLENDREFIKTDFGCLYQLLKNWWMMRTSRPIFRKENERQTIPFTSEDWAYCLGILEDMKSLGALEDNASMMYLYGLTLFHKQDYRKSLGIFESLAHRDFSSGGGGGRRIILYYLASSENGSPIKYNGRIRSISYEKNQGTIDVEELRRNIRFTPREFRDSSLKVGTQMEPFHIGFNFIGLYVDPVRQYQKRHIE